MKIYSMRMKRTVGFVKRDIKLYIRYKKRPGNGWGIKRYIQMNKDWEANQVRVYGEILR